MLDRTLTSRVRIPEAFDFLFQDAAYKAAHGGRGSAKTLSFAAALVMLSTMEPLRTICGREIQNSIADSVKAAIESRIHALNVGYAFNVTDTYIEVPSIGSLITFKGLHIKPQSVTSSEGVNIFWGEEANSLSQTSLDFVLPTIRGNERNKRAENWFTWNPKLKSDPVDAMLRGPNPPPGSIVREVNYRDNRFFPDVLRRLMIYDRGRDTDRYNNIWLGKYLTKGAARVFKNWRIESFDVPPDALLSFGADWGFSVDPSVLIGCYLVGNTLYIPYEAWAVGCPIDRLPALFDTAMPLDMARAYTIRADSARPETIDYMRRHGYRKIIGATKGAGSVEDGIEFLQSFDIVVHPRCVHTIDELTFYSWKVNPKNEKEIFPVLEEKHNHTIDSLRYATEGTRRGNYRQLLENVG